MSRLRKILFLAVPALLLLLVFVFDVARSVVDPELPGLILARELVVLVAFVMLYLVFDAGRKQRKQVAPKEMGRLLILSFGVLVLVSVFSMVSGASKREPDAFDASPTTFAIFLGFLSSVLLVSTAIYLFVSIRELILFKRKHGTRRNIALYQGCLLATCASAFVKLPFDQAILTSLLFTGTIVFAAANSFKQNWIVYLSRREKIYSIVYSSLLFAVLVLVSVMIAQSTFGSKSLMAFSRSLYYFVQLNVIFGAIYFGMAFVSTLFHLPTAEVFERKQSELNSLHNLSRLVTQVFDFNELVNTVTQLTLEVCDARSAWLETMETDEKTKVMRMRVVSQRNISSGDILALSSDTDGSLRRQILESRRVLLIDDVWKDKRTSFLKKEGRLKGSLLSVPLVSHGGLIGILHTTKDMENGFDQDDIEVLTTFADHVTIAMENSRLIARSIERERLQQELMVAQRMQKRLLPQHVPEYPTVDIAAVSESSFEVGGDYYDFIPLPNNRLGIVVGDVSGKGVSAAFYMAEVKGIFLSLSRICSSPKELLTRANQTLTESLERRAFVSLVYGILDLATGELTVARAGHCPVVYVHDEVAELVRPTGLGLGLTNELIFDQSTEERTIKLKPNEMCLFYTDGITESRNPTEEFGYDRLLQSAREARGLRANEAKNHILQSVRTFTGASTYDDDMTLVVITWQGNPVA